VGIANISFDHVHLISENPHASAAWYVDKLGGAIETSGEVRGAPQIYVRFDGAVLIIRGRRPGEEVDKKGGLQWGTDHFGFSVSEDLEGFCGRLKQMGVRFTLEPTDINPALRIAFILGPDDEVIELLQRL
jgi:catechol 2,3-dioxygenase-like lactoylglutathione lyase family enzyme